MKKKYLLGLLIILLIIGVYAVGNSFTSPSIKPKEQDKITVCFEVKIKYKEGDIETEIEEFCRKYPIDLLNYCQYGRYNQVIGECRNIFQEEIESDLKNWYTIKLPEKIEYEVELEDLEITSINHKDYEHLVGCKFDFLGEGFSC